MSKIIFMQKILFIIALAFCILVINDKTFAQDIAPTYQSLMSNGDKEFNKGEYIKAKSYYQEALRIKNNDPSAKSKLNKTLDKIREQSEKEEFAFVLVFNTPPFKRPIRHHSAYKYVDLLI